MAIWSRAARAAVDVALPLPVAPRNRRGFWPEGRRRRPHFRCGGEGYAANYFKRL